MSRVSRIAAWVVCLALLAAPTLAETSKDLDRPGLSSLWASVWSAVSAAVDAIAPSDPPSATEGDGPAAGEQGSGDCDSGPIMDPNG